MGLLRYAPSSCGTVGRWEQCFRATVLSLGCRAELVARHVLSTSHYHVKCFKKIHHFYTLLNASRELQHIKSKCGNTGSQVSSKLSSSHVLAIEIKRKNACKSSSTNQSGHVINTCQATEIVRRPMPYSTGVANLGL